MTGIGIADTKAPTTEAVGRPRKRTIVIIVGSLLGIVVVAGVVLAAFYLGAKIGHAQPHKTAVLFHTMEDGKNVDISETIVIKEKEVDVKGSDFTMINDYENFLSIIRVEDEDEPRCFVANLNTSVFGTMDQVKARYNASKLEVTLRNNTPEVTFVKSDLTFNANMLSDNARYLCAGLPIKLITQENDQLQDNEYTDGRNKRQARRRRSRRRQRRCRRTNIGIVAGIIIYSCARDKG